MHPKRYPINICFKLSYLQEYNNLYMEDPHNLLSISTFSCPCSLIICSTIHSGIHKGSVPSSLDYIHLYPLLESQELGNLWAGGWGFALVLMDRSDLSWEKRRRGHLETRVSSEYMWLEDRIVHRHRELFCVSEILVKWAPGQPWKRNAVLEAEGWPMPQGGMGGEWQSFLRPFFLYHILLFGLSWCSLH